MNNQGRVTRIEPARSSVAAGPHRGLDHEEPLIFEQDSPGRTGVDLPAVPAVAPRLNGLAPRASIGLPGLSEPQVVRHFTRLSARNYGIDSGFFPLGSCTMKHNPRLNEKMARLPGFADLHPLQPQSTAQGALMVMEQLSDWLLTLTGMASVALSPAAGAHGEFCGLLAIKAAHEAKGEGETRRRVLVPESAHGTNPATAAALGYTVDTIPATPDGRVDLAAFEAKLGPDVAALMLTNPNTCGLFERDIIKVAKDLRESGAYFYCDGANFNAIVGRVRPADLGIDAMHINLHKTFSTPHGGGGPGSGPVVFSGALAPFVPLPYLAREGDRLRLVEHPESGHEPARLKAFHGQMGMFTRALAYCLSHGGDGLHQVSGDAVLNANYVLAELSDILPPPFPGPCMHEALFDERPLKALGISALDLAKALIDEGFHPMTMYFPLVVPGAILIEPTETESRDALDDFIAAIRRILARAAAGETDAIRSAPHLAPRRRLDETRAARAPVLRWKGDSGVS